MGQQIVVCLHSGMLCGNNMEWETDQNNNS